MWTLEKVMSIIDKIPYNPKASGKDKGINNSTKANYKQNLGVLLNKFKTKDVKKLILDFEGIKNYFEGNNNKGKPFTVNTKKTYFTTINGLFTHVEELEIPDDIIQKYKDQLLIYIGKSVEHIKQNIPKDKIVEETNEGPKVIKWQSLVDINDQFTGDKYGSKEHLIIAMYTLIPPRRVEDYDTLRILREYNEKKLFNYIYKVGNIWHMVINVYKTSSTFGEYRAELPSNLGAIINSYVDNYKKKIPNYVFTLNCKNKPYAKNTFGKAIGTTFEKYYGTNLTVDDIRSIFITYLKGRNDISDDEKEKIALQCGHSLKTQATYNKIIADKDRDLSKELFTPSSEKESNVENVIASTNPLFEEMQEEQHPIDIVHENIITDAKMDKINKICNIFSNALKESLMILL